MPASGSGLSDLPAGSSLTDWLSSETSSRAGAMAPPTPQSIYFRNNAWLALSRQTAANANRIVQIDE